MTKKILLFLLVVSSVLLFVLLAKTFLPKPFLPDQKVIIPSDSMSLAGLVVPSPGEVKKYDQASDVPAEIEKVINEVRQHVNSTVTQPLYFDETESLGGMYWKDQEGKLVYVKPAHHMRMFFGSTSSESKARDQLAKEVLAGVIPLIEEALVAQGFIKDSSNVTLDLATFNPEYEIRWVGYTKGKVFCTVSLGARQSLATKDQRSFAPIIFGCSNNFEQSYNEQRPFAEFRSDTRVIREVVHEGAFYKLDTFGDRYGTGHSYIVKKVDGKLVNIFGGQEDPSCDIVEQHTIPSEIAERCFDEKQGLSVKNTH